MFDVAATMPPSAPATIKLLIDTAAQRVLFAEASKDVVDFILGLVAMPLGAVDRLLRAESGDAGAGSASLGSIGSVCASVGKMDASCFQSTAARDALLFDTAGVNLLRPGEPSNGGLPMYVYRCDACLASRLPQGSRGFVRDLGKYTIMDDLTVTPTSNASNVSSVAMLVSLGVRDLHALEERTVSVGHEEAMAILKAALHSKTVLTDAFLSKRRVRPSPATRTTTAACPSPATRTTTQELVAFRALGVV